MIRKSLKRNILLVASAVVIPFMVAGNCNMVSHACEVEIVGEEKDIPAEDGVARSPIIERRYKMVLNLSGEAVGEAARFYKLDPAHVLIISDDVDLPLGKLRLRTGGSAGGHNGLKSIIQHLGTDQFPRLKVGVGGKPHPDYDMADWVLGKLQGEDKKVLDEAVKRAADAVECFLRDGPQKAMNRFN